MVGGLRLSLSLTLPHDLVIAILLFSKPNSTFTLNHILVGLVLRLGVRQSAVLNDSLLVALSLLLHLRLRHQLLN